MPVTIRRNLVSRSVMVLCLGTAVLLLIAQERSFSGRSGNSQPLSFGTTALSSAQPEGEQDAVLAALEEASTPKAPAGTKLVVDLSDRKVYVYKHSDRVATYPLAVGQAGWETPTGTFQVQRMQQNPAWAHPITREVIPAGAAHNPLGKRWIGFWFKGNMEIGFHGTSETDLIGQAVSHGCLRMRDDDVVALYEQVGIGTPVTVNP